MYLIIEEFRKGGTSCHVSDKLPDSKFLEGTEEVIASPFRWNGIGFERFLADTGEWGPVPFMQHMEN